MDQLLVHTCSTTRLQVAQSNGVKLPQANLTDVSCLFMPMSAFSTVQMGWEIGSGWTVYFASGTDIQIGDHLTYNGQSYIARGTRDYANFDTVSYLEVTVQTENAHA